MKELGGWIKIRKYTDGEGKPVCGGCFVPYAGLCKFSMLDERLVSRAVIPGPSCPVWDTSQDRKPYKYETVVGASGLYVDWGQEEIFGFLAGFNAAREHKE